MAPTKKALMSYSLQERGLSDTEADQFVELLKKITPSELDQIDLEEELDLEIPFEGGADFEVALTMLRNTLD